MPVIVIGADTPLGGSIIESLLSRDGEVRAFVTDQKSAERLKSQRVKVALGDVSDFGHVGAAATRCFTAVVLQAAATDERERAFATDAQAVMSGWIDAIGEANVRRLIWVGADAPESVAIAEYATIDPTNGDPAAIAAEVAALDELASL